MPTAPAPKVKPEDDPRVALDLALKLRRGQVKAKDIPKDMLPKVSAVAEGALLRHAIETSRVKRFGKFNRPPATRQRSF